MYSKCNALSRNLFVLCKGFSARTLFRCTPSFRTRRYFSHHSNLGQFSTNYPSFAGGDTNAIDFVTIASSLLATSGTRIDRDISLIMPLRLRGGFATECHAFSYYTSSSALIFSPPCGSCSVFEVAHSVYKNALNECSLSACAKGAHTKQIIWQNCGKSFYPCSN